MKQKLYLGLILNLSLLFVGNIISQASATEQPSKTESPATTLKQWQAQLNNSVTIITNIEVQPTATGVELTIDTLDGKRLRRIKYSQGNNLIIDLANVQLNLREPSFIRTNPAEGISQVRAIALPVNKIRITISGIEGTPTGKIITSDRGLIVNATPPLSVADTQTQPDQVIDVIVTAQKQPEKPEDVPISLTTLDRQEIEDAKIDSFRDVAANTPNFFTTVSDRAFNFISIRGLGNGNFLSRDSIGFFVDDVPYEYAHQFLPGALFDVERIEVLRGPQSSLYGRNSQAGVVNVISRQPTNSPEIILGASYGNFNQRQLEFSGSRAIIKDKLKFRVAGIYDARDGFTENTFLGEDANNLSTIAGRVNLLWTPNQQWDIALNATVAANNDGDNTYVPIDTEEPFETELNVPGDTDLSTNTQSLRVDYQGKGFKVTSISARNGTNHNYNADGDYSPEDLFKFDVRQESNIISQEIRVQSPDNSDRAAYPSGNRLRWLAGFYFQDRNYDIDPQQLKFSPVAGLAFFATETARRSVTQGRYDQTTIAGFGQIDYKPIEPLTLTAGLRYENSDEELSRRNFVIFEGDNSAETTTPFVDSSVDDTALIPKLAAEYSFNSNLAAYASVTRGYKPPSQNYSTEDPNLRFDTEYLTSAFVSDTAGSTLASFGDRRTFGVQVKAKF